MITQERVKELFYYHPESGDLVWLVSRGCVKAGAQVGVPLKGYLRVQIDGSSYLVHRVIWLYMTGNFPPDQIDHEDLVRHHNWWTNLRASDGTQQNANKQRQRNNTSGIRGVSARGDKWYVVIRVARKQKFLGRFESKEDAAAAYHQAAKQHFGEFMRARP